MRRIYETVTTPAYDTSGWRLYTEGLSAVIFDIETTGLSSSRNALILGGVLNANAGKSDDASPTGEPGGLHQYLASSPLEERELLECYISDLECADIWISYNGDTFDRPFLSQRLFRNKICNTLPLHQSLDLYRLFRRYSPMAKLLPDLRQTTLEKTMGFSSQRQDEITGKESIALYEEYVRTGNKAVEQKILLHNHDDLLMLANLMSMLDKMDLHRIMFQRGFMTGFQEKRILAEKITLGKNFLKIEGRTRNVPGDYDVYNDAYQWSHRQEDASFTLSIPCFYEKNATFIDIETFGIDFTALTVYPSYVSGYLLLSDGHTTAYREINHTIKIILKEILQKI